MIRNKQTCKPWLLALQRMWSLWGDAYEHYYELITIKIWQNNIQQDCELHLMCALGLQVLSHFKSEVYFAKKIIWWRHLISKFQKSITTCRACGTKVLWKDFFKIKGHLKLSQNKEWHQRCMVRKIYHYVLLIYFIWYI